MDTIIITGGCGFVGANVVRLAIQKGFNVVNVDALTYAASDNTNLALEELPNYKHVNLDIRDRDATMGLFELYQPTYILHLAAESHVDRSIDDPDPFITTNILGTLNLLEGARRYFSTLRSSQTFLFHHVSTDEVYGSLPLDGDLKFTETTSYSPASPYSASKASSDHLARAWFKTYGLPTIITNCSNNYGPYQHPEKLIPKIIVNALQGRVLPIYGEGKNVRDWLYVEDHASALFKVLLEGQAGRVYNIGSENEITNLDVAESICDILDDLRPRKNFNYRSLIDFVPDRPGHDARYGIDPSRIQRELGWKAKFSFQVGLKKTIEWYLQNPDWWEPILLKESVDMRLGLKSV